MVILEIYNKETGETVDIDNNDYFADYGVLIALDGSIAMTQFGECVCMADDEVYGVRIITL